MSLCFNKLGMHELNPWNEVWHQIINAIYMYVYTYLHACMHICMYVIRTFLHACIQMYIPAYACMYIQEVYFFAMPKFSTERDLGVIISI